jgi:outer membrane protein assembly factor BamB
MRRIAFVCFGSDKRHNPLVYQELPRRESGEEFFIFFSPAPAAHEGMMRELFREAISFSRLGHPSHYFFHFVNRFKQLIQTIEKASEALAHVRIAIMIRRADNVFLFTDCGLNAVHWDGATSGALEMSRYPGVLNIPLREEKEQADLFEQPIEDMFILRHFKLAEGDHSILLLPSRDFYVRYAEQFKNNVFFPSFEIPSETGIDIETEKTFPAMHWNTTRMVSLSAPTKPRRRISIPFAVGFVTLVIVLLVLFAPRPERSGIDESEIGGPLLGVAESENDQPAAAEQTPGQVSRSSLQGERQIELAESWKKGFEAPVTSSPAYCDGKVVFGSRDGSIYAFSPEGQLIWQCRTGNGVGASPSCASGKVIAANYAGDVICLDGGSGEKLWTHKAGDKIVSSPRVRSDFVIVGTMAGNLMALRMKDGSRLWSKKIGTSIWAGTTIAKDYIIAATTDGTLAKFDHKGKILWSAVPGGGILSTPLCLEDENLVVFGTKDKYIYGYSLSGGDLMWRYLCGGEVNAPPVAAGSSILVGSEDGNLYALSMTGQLLWKKPLGGTVLSKPYVLQDKVFVTTYGSKIYALDTKSGKVISEFRASSPIYSSPQIGGDRVFFGSNGGVFYSLWIYEGGA